MSAREEILGRIRSALVDRPPPLPIPRTYRRATGAGVETFVDRLVDYKADVRRVSRNDVPSVIAELSTGQRSLVPAGFPQPWRPPRSVEDDNLSPREIAAFDLVVTCCTLAIAETGTLILTHGTKEGRRAITLVPDMHVCIVEARQIVDCLVTALDELARDQRPVTFIAGPSATSDIELNRVEGVHGPRRLVVVIADEAPPGGS